MGNGLCSGTEISDSLQPSSPTTAAANGRRTDGPAASPPAATPDRPRNPEAASAAATPGAAVSPEVPGPATPPQQAAPPAAAFVPRMAPTPADRKAAEDLKAEGNTLFTKGKYAAAIDKYTEAITLCPEWAVLYVNRGMAARKRGDWERVEADACAALGLGPGEREAMKGHYLMGLAMSARGQHLKSTQHLRKALDAAREANDSIKDDIWRELATANYQNWQAESTARRQQHAQLKRQLTELLRTVRPTGAALRDGEQLPSEWAALFRSAAWQDVASEAPSQFTCPLTMEIFRDPVVVPSGRSYERSALLEHLKKVGRFDPITRQPLGEQHLVSNVSLRAAIELYLEEHPWGWGEVK